MAASERTDEERLDTAAEHYAKEAECCLPASRTGDDTHDLVVAIRAVAYAGLAIAAATMEASDE